MTLSSFPKLLRQLGVLTAIVSLSACSALQSQKVGQSAGKEYTIVIKNTLSKERFAPILVVGDPDNQKIWVGSYVSPEARTQFTTGNPAPLAAQLGGDQGLPGKLGSGESLTFTFKTTSKTARILAMVHPDVTPDNYVTALLELGKDGNVSLERFDIGDDEKRMTVQRVGPAGTVTWQAN